MQILFEHERERRDNAEREKAAMSAAALRSIVSGACQDDGRGVDGPAVGAAGEVEASVANVGAASSPSPKALASPEQRWSHP